MTVAHYQLVNTNPPGRNRQYSGDASHFRMPGHQTVEFHRCGRFAYAAAAGKRLGITPAGRSPDGRGPSGAAPRNWSAAVGGAQVNRSAATVRTVRTVTDMG
jgi:hypothetical protein